MKTLFLLPESKKVIEDAASELVGMEAKKDINHVGGSHDFLGVSTKLAGTGTNCYPSGICTSKHLVGNYTLFAKTYTIEDSIILRAITVFGAKMLEGGFMTIIPNVKDKQPLYRDEIRVRYQSTANGGKSGRDCGPFDPHGAIDMITNKCIHTYFLYVESAICYKDLVGSFQQRMLNSGQLFSEENTALNDRLLDEVVASNARQTDRLIWKGDFKSPVDDICHYDGLIKKTFQAIGNAVNHSLEFVFTGTLGATECFEVTYGGQSESFIFDTNTSTTIGNVATWLQGLVHPITLQPLVTVAFNGTDTITLVSNFYRLRIEMEMQSTDCNGLACTATGSVTIVETELVVFKVSDAPLTIPYVPINAANVLEQVQAMLLKAAAEHPDLTMQPDFWIHVSPFVWKCLQAATVKLTGAFLGVNGDGGTPTPFGLRLVEQPGLHQTNVMFGSITKNLFFGTDLISDMQNTQTWINIDCQEVRFRHESRQGVQIDRFRDVICNLDGAPYTFQPAQVEDCVAVGNC